MKYMTHILRIWFALIIGAFFYCSWSFTNILLFKELLIYEDRNLILISEVIMSYLGLLLTFYMLYKIKLRRE